MSDALTTTDLDALLRAAEAAPPLPWSRDWYEDGEEGEGPYGVYPGSPGEWAEGTMIVTAPSNERPESDDVCECFNERTAVYVKLAANLGPPMAREVLTLRAELSALRTAALKLCARAIAPGYGVSDAPTVMAQDLAELRALLLGPDAPLEAAR